MLWILIGIVGLIALMCWLKADCLEEVLCSAGLTLFVGVMIIGIYIAGSISSLKRNDRTPTRTEQCYTELVAMRMGDATMSGSFIFGSGSFGSSEQYVYMYRTKNGALKKGHQNAYNCTVRETDTTSPRLVYDRRFITSWLLPWEVQMRDSAPEFIVPVGSVTYKFEIN